jgi:hypothetical protein
MLFFAYKEFLFGVLSFTQEKISRIVLFFIHEKFHEQS